MTVPDIPFVSDDATVVTYSPSMGDPRALVFTPTTNGDYAMAEYRHDGEAWTGVRTDVVEAIHIAAGGADE